MPDESNSSSSLTLHEFLQLLQSGDARLDLRSPLGAPRGLWCAQIFAQGAGALTIQTPADQSYWSKSKPTKGRYIWVGDLNGLRKIKVTDRSAKSGIWKLVVKGREVPDAEMTDPYSVTAVDVSVTMGSVCAGGVY